MAQQRELTTTEKRAARNADLSDRQFLAQSEQRQNYLLAAEEHGWPERCADCGDLLEDPQNSDYDAFCNQCCSYVTWDREPHSTPST